MSKVPQSATSSRGCAAEASPAGNYLAQDIGAGQDGEHFVDVIGNVRSAGEARATCGDEGLRARGTDVVADHRPSAREQIGHCRAHAQNDDADPRRACGSALHGHPLPQVYRRAACSRAVQNFMRGIDRAFERGDIRRRPLTH